MRTQACLRCTWSLAREAEVGAKTWLSSGLRRDTSDPQASLCLTQEGHRVTSHKKGCLDFNLIWRLVEAVIVIVIPFFFYYMISVVFSIIPLS